MNNKLMLSSSSGTFKFFSDNLDPNKIKHLENTLAVAANGDNNSFYSYQKDNLVIYIFEDEQCKKKNVEASLRKIMNEFKNNIVSLNFCIKEEEKIINNNNYSSYSGIITTKYHYDNESDDEIIVTVITNSTSSRVF